MPRTLSFDIGGTGLKASVLSKQGELLHEPVRIPTPYPLRPEQLVAALGQMATGLPSYQRVSAGFPGMVREGRVLSAPHFVCPSGEGSKSTVELEKAWSGFELQQALASALGRPCRVANDADVQGAAVVKGEGLEFVVTLGTGVGTALFWQGKLAPHLELAQHPLSKRGKTYNEVLGEADAQEGRDLKVERPGPQHARGAKRACFLRSLLHRRRQLDKVKVSLRARCRASRATARGSSGDQALGTYLVPQQST